MATKGYFDDSGLPATTSDVDEDAGTSQESDEGTEVSFNDMTLEQIQEHLAKNKRRQSYENRSCCLS